jgi:16S rRNA G527 N7-methylase RsmG
MENLANKNKIIKPKITDESERKRRRSESYQKYNSKTKIVNFRLSNEEYYKYSKEAEKLDFKTIGAFAKTKFLYQSNEPFVPLADKKLIIAINTKIGNNLNQIARALNTHGSKVEHASLLQELNNIKSELQTILKILKRDTKN